MAIEVSPSLRRRVLDTARAAERDFSEGLTIAQLAEMAGLSDKHFQRCFREVVGETPKSYVRRIRLQQAAYLLKWSDASVIDLAMNAGFSTHSGFTKAFTKAYGLSPVEFRREHNVTPYLQRNEGELGEIDAEAFTPSRLVVRIQQTPARRVAAMRHTGPVETTPQVWSKMVDWARRRGVFTPKSTLLGIHNDYWDTLAEDRYRYDAAIVVPDDFTPDDEVSTFVMPAGPVAMTEFSGSLAEADTVWRRFVDQWLPVSGYQARTGYAFDRYPIGLIEAGPLRRIVQTLTGIQATFCLPVRK